MDKVLIVPEAYARLQAYIQGCTQEISGLGTVEVEDGFPVITDIHLFEQEVSAASTDLSADDISKFLAESVRLNLDVAKLRLWWHSHANMGVFWSGTDTGTINTCFGGCDWMVSIVGNRKNEFKTRVDLYTPFRLVADSLPLVQKFADSELDVTEEIKAKVKQKTYSYNYGGKGYQPGKGYQRGYGAGQEGWRGFGYNEFDDYDYLCNDAPAPGNNKPAGAGTDTQVIKLGGKMRMAVKRFRTLRAASRAPGKK